MQSWTHAPPEVNWLPVVGSSERFLVNRVLCLGRNYPWPGDLPGAPRQAPLYFMKPASSVILAEGELPYPVGTSEFCPEIELVVALNRGGRNIPVSQARDHVWGYGAGLDLTRRDLQKAAKATGQSWEAAKAFDGAAPVTALAPASLIGHPESGALWLRVNGQERQRSDLARQLWSVPEVISLLSGYLSLRPGDLIMTGTPAGVQPLCVGDRLQAAIEGVASLEVSISAARPLTSPNAVTEEERK